MTVLPPCQGGKEGEWRPQIHFSQRPLAAFLAISFLSLAESTIERQVCQSQIVSTEGGAPHLTVPNSVPTHELAAVSK